MTRMLERRASVLAALLLLFGVALAARAQTAQKGASTELAPDQKLRIDRIEYRPARWETEALREIEQDTPNQGGLIHIYLTNTSDESRRLRYYRLNGKDESHWLLGRFLAWHRWYDTNLRPGQSTVLEVNAVSAEFAEGNPLSVAIVDGTWEPVGFGETALRPDPVRVASIVMPDNLSEMTFHVRYTGTGSIRFTSAEVLNHTVKNVTWTAAEGQGPAHTIGTLALDKPMAPSELLILRIGVEENGETRQVYAHRRAHTSRFPIGAWSGDESTYAFQRRIHIDTLVQGGRKEDPFYAELVPKYGLHTMVHASGVGAAVDTLRSLGGHPAVTCWMLYDEPDWSILPSDMLLKDQSTKSIDASIPTMITLCRNVKFFEYASIPDIPCHDHYCVGAPTSSVWPHIYGTRLEETGYYTRDLKEASEPKPIWVWSQAIADWDQRPKRYCPTPDEIAAQLMFNLGRGAKGILWFNFSQKEADRFPDAVEAMRDWGRVMRVVRDDLLLADPVALRTTAPDQVDVAPLVAPDKLLLCVTNQNYEIHPESYPFTPHENVTIETSLPAWIDPARVVAVTPEGVTPVEFERTDTGLRIALGELRVCTLLAVLNDAADESAYQKAYEVAITGESATFE
ncbi:MAG: hypothetical protein KF886_07415 [Candidatus Hydrogenedentes bacterium]|nr:hypothetical protein [Candidatus Hydrogenedentota bacterium]